MEETLSEALVQTEHDILVVASVEELLVETHGVLRG